MLGLVIEIQSPGLKSETQSVNFGTLILQLVVSTRRASSTVKISIWSDSMNLEEEFQLLCILMLHLWWASNTQKMLKKWKKLMNVENKSKKYSNFLLKINGFMKPEKSKILMILWVLNKENVIFVMQLTFLWITFLLSITMGFKNIY